MTTVSEFGVIHDYDISKANPFRAASKIAKPGGALRPMPGPGRPMPGPGKPKPFGGNLANQAGQAARKTQTFGAKAVGAIKANPGTAALAGSTAGAGVLGGAAIQHRNKNKFGG